MTDLDTALRNLGDSAFGAPADPPTSGMGVRLAAGRRRRRRHLATAEGLLLATAGVIAGAAIWNPLASSAPSDSAGTTRFSPAPGDADLIGNYPHILALPAGGTALLAGPDVISGTAFITDTDCLALRLPGPSGEQGIATALVLPPGTLSTESRSNPGALLGNDAILPQGAQISATGTAYPKDNRYAAACPGTTGYVELNRPDLIGWDPPLEDRTPNTDDNFTAATGVTWMTSIGAVTLAPDVVGGGERTVTEPASASAARAPLGLTGSSITPADQHVAVVKDPAELQIRWLTLYADDSTAYDAMLAWGEAAKLASGTAVAGPPDLMSTYAVSTDGDDLLIVHKLTDTTGSLYIGSGHLGIRRIGNALLMVSSTSEAKATPDNAIAWTTDDQELLATLGKGLCRFTATGCD